MVLGMSIYDPNTGMRAGWSDPATGPRYTSIENTGSGGATMGVKRAGMSSAQIAEVMRSIGMRGLGADALSRSAWRDGMDGMGDVFSYAKTGRSAADAALADYAAKRRDARDRLGDDMMLEAFKDKIGRERAVWDKGTDYRAAGDDEAAVMAGIRNDIDMRKKKGGAEVDAVFLSNREKAREQAGADALTSLVAGGGGLDWADQHESETLRNLARAGALTPKAYADSRERIGATKRTGEFTDSQGVVWRADRTGNTHLVKDPRGVQVRAVPGGGKAVIEGGRERFVNGSDADPLERLYEQRIIDAEMAGDKATAAKLEELYRARRVRSPGAGGPAAVEKSASEQPAPAAAASPKTAAEYAKMHGIAAGWKGTIGGKPVVFDGVNFNPVK